MHHMDLQQPQSQSTVSSQSKPILKIETKKSYFTRLFSGRLNRQNYIIGSTFFVILPTICFLVVIFNSLLSPNTFAMPYLNPNNPSQIITPQISILSLLTTPANEAWSLAGVIFIILSIPYLFSMQIRRQHDLNLSGWLWIINLLPMLSLYSYIPGNKVPIGSLMWIMINSIATIASFFTFYISLWPGTKGENRYGSPPLPRMSLMKDILALK
jgi:uncharacterized membrane protein YhaH (DUF805 family)